MTPATEQIGTPLDEEDELEEEEELEEEPPEEDEEELEEEATQKGGLVERSPVDSFKQAVD